MNAEPDIDRFDLQCAARVCGLPPALLDEHLRSAALACVLHMVARRIRTRRDARLRAGVDRKTRAAGDHA